jgi:Na+-translocating ferredoxin:NAD+ oxidoreductase RnfG subunit
MKIVTALVCATLFAAEGKTYFTQQEALQEIWGEAELTSERYAEHTFYMSQKSTDDSSACFISKRVRSKGQSLMLHVAADGTIIDLVVCHFGEPVRYKAPPRFYQQFVGKKLNDDLRLKRDIDGISGATLTSRATVTSVREILEAHAEK